MEASRRRRNVSRNFAVADITCQKLMSREILVHRKYKMRFLLGKCTLMKGQAQVEKPQVNYLVFVLHKRRRITLGRYLILVSINNIAMWSFILTTLP